MGQKGTFLAEPFYDCFAPKADVRAPRTAGRFYEYSCARKQGTKTVQQGAVQGTIKGTATVGEGVVQGAGQAGQGIVQRSATVAKGAGQGHSRSCEGRWYGSQKDRQGCLVRHNALLRLLGL
jgi:hypothetical protein